MPSSGCSQLARAVKDLSKLSQEDRNTALQNMSTMFSCVECSQTAEFDNILAGGSVNIGDVNQIMSCGIGNSSGTEMVTELRKFIDDKSNDINTNVNKKIDNSNKSLNEKLLKNNIELRTEIQKISRIGSCIACILFIIIMILILMKILGI